MAEYIFVSVILAIFFIFLGISVFKECNNQNLIINIIISIFFSVVFKYYFSDVFFGIEYEDSYVFNFVSRQYSKNIFPNSFLTDGIGLGSLIEPVKTYTYGGHFITYPVLLSWVVRIVGYTPQLPSFVNFGIEILKIFILVTFTNRLFNNKHNLYFLPLIYCISPAINVFSTSQLSETFSSFVVLVCLFSFLSYYKNYKQLDLCLFIIALFVAIITKRENTVILFIIILYPAVNYFIKGKSHIIFPIIISVIIITLYLIFIQNIFTIERFESSDINAPTFSIDYLIKLAPLFLKTLFSFKWFSISFTLFLLSIIYYMFFKKKDPAILSLIVLFFSYLFIYSFHYRSFYFVHGNKVSSFETLRYLNNFYFIIPIISSLFILDLFQKKKIQIFIIIVCVPIILTSFINTRSLREELSNFEYKNRFSTPSKIINLLERESDFVIITDIPLIFQILGPDHLFVSTLLDLSSNLPYLEEKNKYIYLNNYKAFTSRYPHINSEIQGLKLSEVYKFNAISKLYKIIN